MSNIIIYDFDGTLTPYKLTKFQILEKCGLKDGALNPKFLEMVEKRANDKNINVYCATYEVFFQLMRDANLKLVDENLSLGADHVTYNNGVEDFLKFLKENGIHNYLLSSGLKVYLDKTNIVKYFDKIYATTFTYNSDGDVIGVDNLMSDRNKVIAVKDILHSMGRQGDDCRNVVYIGDGFTDRYAMEYVKRNGGTSIFVYKEENSELKKLEAEDIVSFSSVADYSDNSELRNYVKKLFFSNNK